jgi:NaMN:DMB phosphoribosyltransferase
VVREGVGAWREMTQALYAHMNNKTIKKKKENGSYFIDLP